VSRLKVADGVELHVSERGEGPLVVLAPYWSLHPGIFEPLTRELEGDHRVVRFDDRGTGESTRSGPFDLETSSRDLGAVIEAAGGGAVIVAIADACNRGVRVAADRPELVQAVVTVGGVPMTAASLDASDSMMASRPVVDAFLEMAENDYRAAIRTIVTTANEQLRDEDQIRNRVRMQEAHTPAEAGTARLRAWTEDRESEAFAKRAAERLWFLSSPTVGGPWFPRGDEYRRLIERVLPGAHVEEVDDGVVTRPDQTAAVVRRITAAAAVPR
jgi:pimeloyl-ACP methyl ester carboxylesterase